MNKEECVYRKAISLYIASDDRITSKGTPFHMLSPDQQSVWLMRAREAIRQEEGQSDEERDSAMHADNLAVSKAIMDALNTGKPLLGQGDKAYIEYVLLGCQGLIPYFFAKEELSAEKILLLYYSEVSPDDAIQMLHRYYLNMKERYEAFKTRNGLRGEPPRG